MPPISGSAAYGAGLTLKFIAASTPLAMLFGTLLGGVLGTLFGLLIVRRRGVYFAMVTIAFGQVCYYIAYSWNDLTGGFDGLRGFQRAPIDFGPWVLDLGGTGPTFYYFLLAMFAVAVTVMGLLLRSPFGRTLLAIRENERRARLSRHPGGTPYLAVPSRSPASSPPSPARSMRCSTISPIRWGCIIRYRVKS